jgi:hypothetical protein
MTILYTYLDDGDPFTAASLNTLFEAGLGLGYGLNNLSLEDMAPGALRHNQLPALIHKKDNVAAGTQFTNAVAKQYGTYGGIEVGSNSESPTEVVAVGPMGLNLGEGTVYEKYRVDALIVLANVCVEKFLQPAQGPEDLNEDVSYIRFWIQVERANAALFDINRSRRILSPRITIDSGSTAFNGGIGIPTTVPGGTGTDVRTDQDVAIRTVILPGDLPTDEAFDISFIRLIGYCSKLGLITESMDPVDAKVTLSQANITVIPVQAEVT